VKTKKPTNSNICILAQLCKLIPTHLVAQLATKHGVDKKARTFSPWSHVVCLLYAQLTHAMGLMDVVDSLRCHVSKLWGVRGACPPTRNTLSHANRERNSAMAEDLFWTMLKYLQSIHPPFQGGTRYSGLPRRFKKAVHVIDSSTFALVANCMDWASHRRRKAAAKMHLRLSLNSFLPGFVLVEEASHHDSTRAHRLCAALGKGEIVIFDKAYVDFKHLHQLHERGVHWIGRAKDNMAYHVCRKLLRKPEGKILRDDLITLQVNKSRQEYPSQLRRVEALVEVNGEERVMVFITNNTQWAPSSVCDLYKARWGIEVFFKQIKQTLQISNFLGQSKNAIRWQLWTALLLYILLRFLAHIGRWPHGFTRIVTLLRGVVWDYLCLLDLLQFYGTASGSGFRDNPPGAQCLLELDGFFPKSCGIASA